MWPRLLPLVAAAGAAGAAGAACGGGAAAPASRAPIANTPGPEPAAAERDACTDPIAGTWRARVYRPGSRVIDEVTLVLARDGRSQLRGAIIVETWTAGDDGTAAPPSCPDGSPAVSRVVQTATGTLHGIAIDIVGSDPERTVFPCGVESGLSYNPDHFTGKLADGPTLVTTNDDGGADQGTPHVFTRTACSRSP